MAEYNKIVLCGTVCEDPTYSHELFGEKFYLFSLSVKRLSGQADVLPVLYSEKLIEPDLIRMGERLHVEGQVRTYNQYEKNKSRLHIQIFSRNIALAHTEEEDSNEIALDGYVCKKPIYRVTPFNREIADLLMAVNRAFNKSDYIPAIFWGRNARFTKLFKIGDRLKLNGRLQSRQYWKKLDEENVEERTTYEVSVSAVERLESVDPDAPKTVYDALSLLETIEPDYAADAAVPPLDKPEEKNEEA